MSKPASQSLGSVALEQYVPALRRYFARRAHTDDIDDLIQEVFLRMQSPTAAPAKQPERYLFRVAGSVLIDRTRRATVRHEKEHEDLQELHHPVEERSPERVILDQEALDRVVAAIQRLPERTREVFVLHRFEEMTCESIARQLSISASAVEKHIMRALVALHDELKKS